MLKVGFDALYFRCRRRFIPTDKAVNDRNMGLSAVDPLHSYQLANLHDQTLCLVVRRSRSSAK
jgi:hypothetical protein